jgi:hypothetical protein
MLRERQNELDYFVNLNVFLIMAIACHARPDSCGIAPSLFRANAAGVVISLDFRGFLMERDDETI